MKIAKEPAGIETRQDPRRQSSSHFEWISQEVLLPRPIPSRKIKANRIGLGSCYLLVFLPRSNLIIRRLFWPWAVISGFVFLLSSPTSTCLPRGLSQGYCNSTKDCVTPMQANQPLGMGLRSWWSQVSCVLLCLGLQGQSIKSLVWKDFNPMHLVGLFINVLSPGQRELVLFPALKWDMSACMHTRMPTCRLLL